MTAQRVSICPWDGGDAELQYMPSDGGFGAWTVACSECYAQGPAIAGSVASTHAKAEAIREWNRVSIAMRRVQPNVT